MTPRESIFQCLIAMFAKSSKFIAPLVVVLIACLTVEANHWCTCSKPQTMSANTVCTDVGGSYTGGNCLMPDSNHDDTYLTLCSRTNNSHQVPGGGFCWDSNA
ncbi:hypothetical protein BGZ99_008840 [Dissophora globulifera]|uniref:Uncharacterized protein n=1 Tax=Dissophora globulifera TaxID=979702 RepID=A0A9P6UP99_9FUNG|nr:hypothetical protein BGZ99_008840 [Dissophora globulifera]